MTVFTCINLYTDKNTRPDEYWTKIRKQGGGCSYLKMVKCTLCGNGFWLVKACKQCNGQGVLGVYGSEKEASRLALDKKFESEVNKEDLKELRYWDPTTDKPYIPKENSDVPYRYA